MLLDNIVVRCLISLCMCSVVDDKVTLNVNLNSWHMNLTVAFPHAVAPAASWWLAWQWALPGRRAAHTPAGAWRGGGGSCSHTRTALRPARRVPERVGAHSTACVYSLQLQRLELTVPGKRIRKKIISKNQVLRLQSQIHCTVHRSNLLKVNFEAMKDRKLPQSPIT